MGVAANGMCQNACPGPACWTFVFLGVMLAGMIILNVQSIDTNGENWTIDPNWTEWTTEMEYTIPEGTTIPDAATVTVEAADGTATTTTADGTTTVDGDTTSGTINGETFTTEQQADEWARANLIVDEYDGGWQDAVDGAKDKVADGANKGMVLGTVGASVGAVGALLTSAYGYKNAEGSYRKTTWLSIMVIIVVCGAAFGSGFLPFGGPCLTITSTGVIGGLMLVVGAGQPVRAGAHNQEKTLPSFLNKIAKDESKYNNGDTYVVNENGKLVQTRRRLSPAESVLESMNGSHHRRLAPLEFLAAQIDAAKHASLHEENISQ